MKQKKKNLYKIFKKLKTSYLQTFYIRILAVTFFLGFQHPNFVGFLYTSRRNYKRKT